MEISNLTKYFKPQIWEFNVEKPSTIIQEKLSKIFDRGFFEEIFDSQNNVSGKFTNDLKTTFRIVKIVGSVSMQGGGTFYNGEIIPIDSNTTKIILTDSTSPIILLVLLAFFILFFIPFCIISCSVTDFKNFFSIQTLGFLIFFGFVIFLIAKIGGSQRNSLFEDFEEIFKN